MELPERTGRQQGTSEVLGIRQLTDLTFVLRLKRNGFLFEPGQCVNIGLVKEAVNREYSSYSGKEAKYLEFLIKVIEGGMVSPVLQKMKPGDKVSLDGAYGLFLIKKPEDKKQKYVFIGTGTGIAPFHSFVSSYPGLNYKILHGVRFVNEQYDKKDYEKSRYLACVSREEGGDFQGRVTDYLRKNKKLIDKKTLYYLCGNSEMINDVYDILSEEGVSGSNIITEVFF